MTLRILLVSDFYPPFMGGTERHVQLLGRGLARRGHDVGVATTWQRGLSRREVDSGTTVFRLSGLATRVSWFASDRQRRFTPPWPDPGLVWSLRRLVGQWQPDIVHAHGWIAYSCAVALLGRKDVGLVVSVQDYGYTCAVRTLLDRGRVCSAPRPGRCLVCASARYGIPRGIVAVSGVHIFRDLLRRKAGAMLSISGYVQEVMRRQSLHGNARGPACEDVVIPPVQIESRASPAGEQRPSPNSTVLLPNEPFILFVGALQAHKGVDVLLEAYERLAAPPPLVLIGTAWPDTRQRFPRGVQVLRDVPNPGVMMAWERSLFGVAPSVWAEPFGAVVAEAMSKGKAMIGTQPGGHTDLIVHGETGLLVPACDVDALTNAMARLIADAALRERLGRAARARIDSRFTADVIVPQIEALYRKVIQTRARRAREAATWRENAR